MPQTALTADEGRVANNVMIADSCGEGCQNYEDIDLTPAVFQALYRHGNPNTGEMFNVKWTFLD